MSRSLPALPLTLLFQKRPGAGREGGGGTRRDKHIAPLVWSVFGNTHSHPFGHKFHLSRGKRSQIPLPGWVGLVPATRHKELPLREEGTQRRVCSEREKPGGAPARPSTFYSVSPPYHQELESDFSKPRRALEAERGTRFGDSGPSGDGRARFQSQHPVQITG